MPTEVEVKFRADGPEPLEHLERASGLGPAGLRSAHAVDERDRYLDTADGRLAASLWACRLRTRDGRTRLSLKGPAEDGSGDGLHRRPELEGPADERLDPRGWPPSEARAFLERLTGGTDLVQRFELAQQRTERAVDIGGRVIATLSLDTVEVLAAGDSYGTFRVVEAELERDAEPGDIAVLDEIAAALRRMHGLEPEDRTKLERALELIGAP